LASFDEHSFDQQSSKPSPSMLGRHSDCLNVAIAASVVCAQPGIADDLIIAIWPGDKVVTGWMG
jgi:hypothetical protein